MVAAGPKKAVTADPLEFKGWPRDRAARRARFIKEFLVVPRGHGAGDPVALRDFQREIIKGAFAPGVRTGLISIPRANGKTALAAMIGLAELFVGLPSAEVLVVATDQRQANLTMRLAKRMVELNPELAERVQIFSDRLYVPQNDATLLPLPADPSALHGYDPTLLIVDELHVVTEAVWEACTTAAGKRPESLTLAISTPSNSPDTVMWRLVEHGRSGEDKAFYFREWAAPDGCRIDDPEAWRTANPALSCKRPFLAEDALHAVMKTTREPVFRQLRLGQWVGQVDRWLPWGSWEQRADPGRVLEPGEKITAGFDGSASGDATAIVGCTLDGHLFKLGLWEAPVGDPEWRVPRAEVDRCVNDMFDRFDVIELGCDPWGWRSEIETWGQRHGERRVVEFNTAFAKRMVPATDRLYQAVVSEQMTHDGDPDLARHIGNAVAKATTQGDQIFKDKKGSPRKIDLAVAAIAAFDRAAFHANKPRRRSVSFR